MPLLTFATMLIVVILAAGLTVWFVASSGALWLAAALPVCLIAAATVRSLNK